jgi:2,5-dichlorohydroquinone reductive dechlorinase
METAELQALVEAANTRYEDPERNRVVNGVPGQKPRFELYHFFLSLCSHKVRTVLHEKNAAYVSHDIDILPPNIQNYFPEYVRLRVKGGEDLMGNLVTSYTGRSSTETEGFDPCVVPTLVDHEAGKVLVNSKAICEHIDTVTGEPRLIPDDIRSEVVAQMDIVDRTPHVAVLYGVHPDGDRRPDFIQKGMVGVHDFKIGKVRENLALAEDDPQLLNAYEAKIKKEAAAKEFVHTEQDMRRAIQEFKDIVTQLESDLEQSSGQWIIDDRFTMADIFWAVSLFRIKWVGLGYIWQTDDGRVLLPRVAEYSQLLFDRPSFQSAVVHWPLNPPSQWVMEYY